MPWLCVTLVMLRGALSARETGFSWRVQPPYSCSSSLAPSSTPSPNLLQPLAQAPVLGDRAGAGGWLGQLAQSQCGPINSSLSPADSQARLPHSSPRQHPTPGPQASTFKFSPGTSQGTRD